MLHGRNQYIQRGRGQLLHRSPFIQRGRGFGSFLSGIFNAVKPALGALGRAIFGSPIAQNVGQAIMETARGTAADIVEGKKGVASSTKEGLSTARKRVAEIIRKKPTGNGNGNGRGNGRASVFDGRRPAKRRRRGRKVKETDDEDEEEEDSGDE